MSLFDQQPMGPVPARRPILLPPDPELEGATPDPSTAHVDLVGPLPPELELAAPTPPRPGVAERSVRTILGVLLLAGLTLGVVLGFAGFLAPDGSNMYLPRLIAFAVVAVVLLTTAAVYRRRSRG